MTKISLYVKELFVNVRRQQIVAEPQPPGAHPS
jgi:hypothetical protein